MATDSYHVDHENGADMDYEEHEQTYSMFLSFSKWGVILNIALLVAMAVGFFMGGGFVGGILSFILITVAAAILF